MSGEESNDFIPVKDSYDGRKRIRENTNNPKITRDESHDRYLQVSEENLILKKHLRKQEEKIKQLATKLVKLVGERKNHEKRGDIIVEDQKYRIAELETQLSTLRDRLLVSRQQLASYTKLVPGINKHIKPKVMKSTPLSFAHSHSDGNAFIPDHVAHLLMEARAENQALKDRLQILHGHVSTTDQELSQLREQLTLKEVARQDELITIRNQVELEIESKKKKLADNVNFIRLQRDSKRTASWLETYEAQCRTLEDSLNTTNESLGQAEYQLSEAQEELRTEQHKCIGLAKQVEDLSAVTLQLKEVETRLKSLQDENKILKEGHESLVAKALENADKIKRVEQDESSFKLQIATLENRIRSELQAKAELIAQVNQGVSKSSSIEVENRELEKKCEQMTETLRATQAKLREIGKPVEIPKPDTCEECGRLETVYNEVKYQLVQVKEELIKTKNLLKTQISINKEYQKEIEILSTKLEKSEIFHHDKLQEFMKILEERADQMSHLERNLESFNLKTTSPAPPFVSEPAQSSINNSLLNPGFISPIPNHPDMGPNISLPANSKNQKSTSLPEQQPITTTTPICSTPKPLGNLYLEKLPSEIANSTKSELPTIEIQIDKFIPVKGEEFGRLFIKWETDETPAGRHFSTVATNGIFNARSKSILKENNFPLEGIEVHLYEPTDDGMCRELARGFIVIGSNISVGMHSTDKNGIIGDLIYSCTLSNAANLVNNHSSFQSDSPVNLDSDLQNNNIQLKQKIDLVPLPKPKPRTPLPQQHMVTAEDEDEGFEFDNREDANETLSPFHRQKTIRRKSTKKSILRGPESPKPERKHVSVNDHLEERHIPPETSSFEEAGGEDTVKSEVEQNPPNFIPEDPIPVETQYKHEGPRFESLTDIQEESSAKSSNDEKRKKRRKRKEAEKLENVPEDDRTYSLENDSGSETSRNVSELGSVEEDAVSVGGETGIRIEISYVQFNEKTRIWNDPLVKNFFVEFGFLDFPITELETGALYKPQPGRRAQFNFVKVLLIDTPERRKLLRKMLQEREKIQFTLVTDPAEDESVTCEDIGHAYLSFNEILEGDADINEKEIPIYDAANPRLQIGVLCVSLQAIEVLKTLT